MAIDERSRHELFLKLEQFIGPGEATTLMELLPPVGWADVATKTDLDHLRVATKTDLDHLRVATKTDLDHLGAATKKDIENLRVATKTDLDHLRAATKTDIENLAERFDSRFESMEHKLVGMFHTELNSQTKVMFFSLSSLIITLAALAFTSAQLL